MFYSCLVQEIETTETYTCRCVVYSSDRW